MISIAQLMAPVTSAQVRAKFVSMLQQLGVPADQWRTGGVASSILTIVSQTYASFTTILSDAVASGFLGTASGDWLTLVAFYGYNVIRSPATFATGALTLTNSAGGSFSFAAGEVTVQDATTKATYSNVDPFTLGPGSLSSPTIATVTFQALTAGSASNANPGDISVLVTSMTGVAVTNPDSFVGSDVQSDASLKAACQAKLGSLSLSGPSGAYSYAVSVATNVTTGLPVNVNRTNITLNTTTGTVDVTVASPSGAVTANDLTGITNSIAAVARPNAVTVSLASATPVTYSPALITIWAQALPGVVASDLQTAAASAITAYINVYPIGGLTKGAGISALWGSGVAGAIEEVSPAIFAVDGCTDLTLLPAQVAVDGIVAATQIAVKMVPVP